MAIRSEWKHPVRSSQDASDHLCVFSNTGEAVQAACPRPGNGLGSTFNAENKGVSPFSNFSGERLESAQVTPLLSP
jgi:hypothetical protein